MLKEWQIKLDKLIHDCKCTRVWYWHEVTLFKMKMNLFEIGVKTIEEMQTEFVNILSIAINLPAEKKDEYMKEQRKIIQKDLAISTDEDKIIELDSLRKQSSSQN